LATHLVARARAESGRRESDDRFRELMAHLQQVFWIRNAADDAVLYISPAYETVWGRTCQSLYDNSRTFLDAIHPEERERVAKAMASQRQTGGYEEQWRIQQPTGATRWIWARSYAVRGGQGQVRRFAGIAEDVTETRSWPAANLCSGRWRARVWIWCWSSAVGRAG
jgi:PAS domain S-box-containing protein